MFVRDRKLHTTRRVSLGSLGEGNGASSKPAISADGRFVAFYASATNLVSNDTNGVSDVFVRDRKLHTTRRVSVGSLGEGNGASFRPAISADGRFVAFQSDATNLVSNDTNGVSDVFVRDRKLHTTTRVSVGSLGEGNGASFDAAISADGRFVGFDSSATNLVSNDTNAVEDVFVRDRKLHTTARVSRGPLGEANGDSVVPTISADGRFVGFESSATNLVSNDTNAVEDVFVRGPFG